MICRPPSPLVAVDDAVDGLELGDDVTDEEARAGAGVGFGFWVGEAAGPRLVVSFES